MKFIHSFLFLLLFYSTASAQFNTALIGTLNPYPQAGYNDIWGYVDTLGNEYALLGVRTGVSIISLADPANPVEVAFFPGQQTIWRDLKVHDHYAYVVSDQSTEGMWIIDLSYLPDSAVFVRAQTDYFVRAHNIFIDNGFAYAVGTEQGGGMHILDLTDPVNPVRTNYYLQSGYIHDVYVWNDSVIVCAGSSQNFHLVDVTNKSNPVLVSQSAPIPGIYAHSGWMSEDKRYFFGCDEFNVRDIVVYDLQDRMNWNLIVPEFQLPGGSRVHNLFIKGDYAHISYYGEGYVALDVSNPAQPVFAGQWDTYQGSNGGFDGAWGCYPYLPSGLILVSDTETGLYVIQFNPPTSVNTGEEQPLDFSLYQNYPNPFNPSTTIKFSIPSGEFVKLSVFNSIGELAAELVNEALEAGTHTYTFSPANAADGKHLSSGIYFARLTAGSFSRTIKLSLVK
jgi:choice-of-anchor B domain-containing protein